MTCSVSYAVHPRSVSHHLQCLASPASERSVSHHVLVCILTRIHTFMKATFADVFSLAHIHSQM